MSKYTKLIKNTRLFAISSFGSKILTFLILPLYSFVLTTTEFGIVDIYLTSLNLLLPAVSLSIFDAVFRFVIDAETSKKKLEFFQTGITFSLLCTFISSLVTLTVSLILKDQLVNIWLFWVLLIFQMFISCLQQFVRAIDSVKIYSVSSVLYTFSYLICNIILLVLLKYGVTGYLLSYVFAGIITSSYLIIASQSKIKQLGKFRLSLRHLKSMLRYCIPLTPNAILLWVMNTINRWFILYHCGMSSNGLYAFASKIPTMLSMLTGIFFQAWQLSAIDETKEKDRSFSNQVYPAITIVCFIVTTLILVFTRPMLEMFTEQSYWTAAEYIPFLLLGVVFQIYASFYGTIYIAYKKTWAILVTSAVGAVISIIGNTLFVPLYGVQAACITTMISYFFVWVIRVVDTRRICIIEINKPFVVSSTLLMILQAVTFFIFDLFIVNLFFVVAMTAITFFMELHTFSAIYRTISRKE